MNTTEIGPDHSMNTKQTGDTAFKSSVQNYDTTEIGTKQTDNVHNDVSKPKRRKVKTRFSEMVFLSHYNMFHDSLRKRESSAVGHRIKEIKK